MICDGVGMAIMKKKTSENLPPERFRENNTVLCRTITFQRFSVTFSKLFTSAISGHRANLVFNNMHPFIKFFINQKRSADTQDGETKKFKSNVV